ncbi:EamA family transporter [Aquincola sp. MAHUQ-54]|uniref:EamA family transporter n=1 Tax=Aquincola agrisoli TaxID=3119538 RepID=A0AAW9QDC8_9BURK
MPLLHLLLAVAIVAVWGTNFVVIKIALAKLPPLLLATLRFVFAVLPAIFFLPRPAVRWRLLAAYGVLVGAGQFGLMMVAMRADITPGLASLVVQTQVFFTIALSMLLHRERLNVLQALALALAAGGLVVIATHTDAQTTAAGLAMVLAAALCWASGNLVAKAAGPVNMLAFVVWASLFSVPPLLLTSLLLEGPALMRHSLANADAVTWAAVVWQSVGNTLFGYVCWAWLLARHPAAAVSPMALLVPVFGMGTSALVLGEPLQPWKLGAAALVLGGLALNVLGPRWVRRAR